VGVLALQGDVAEHAGAIARCGAQPVLLRRAAELDTVDGLIIPGGESTTIVKLARHFELFAPLQERISAGLPTFGSCAGMILLADRILDGTADQQTFGGIDATVRRNAFGRQVDSFEAPVEIEGICGEEFTAVFIRAPWVEEVGPAAHPLARVSSGPAAGRIVGIRQNHLLATAFHPELTSDIRVHEYFLEMVRGAMRGESLEYPDVGEQACPPVVQASR
jgi:5'-phosphate synthase pdxT subunit